MGRTGGWKHSAETRRKIAETQIINSLVKQGLAIPNPAENCYDIGGGIKIIPRPGKQVARE